MASWEYATIVMGTPDKEGRRWRIVSQDPGAPAGRQVGVAEKPRLIARLYQGVRLLESALNEMAEDGWELVSHSFSRLVFGFIGTAVLRRPAREKSPQNESSPSGNDS